MKRSAYVAALVALAGLDRPKKLALGEPIRELLR